MGYIQHDMVVVTLNKYVYDSLYADRNIAGPDVEAFRSMLPPEWQALLIGPIETMTNGYVHWIFLADGSKEGWDTSNDGDGYRNAFIELFDGKWHDDHSSPYDVAIIRYGGDEPELAEIIQPHAVDEGARRGLMVEMIAGEGNG